MDVSGQPAAAGPHHLLKILGLTFGVAVAVGEAIGSGILRGPTSIAHDAPDIALILGLWTLGAVQALFQANILAELATAVPKSGGAYLYAHRAFGDVAGLVVGWAAWLSKNAGAAAASVSFAEFLPLIWPEAAAHKIAVALAVQLALYAANVMGLREGRAVQETTSFVKAAMLLAFMVAAAVVVAPAEPASALDAPSALTWSGAILAYQLIMGAYSGWYAPIYFSGENTEPEKTIPKALIIGIALTAVLYIGVNAALLHALGVHGVAATALPYTQVLARIGGPLTSLVFAATAMVTVASCANANIMSAPRVLYALAEDGLLPRVFTRVNKGGSPTAAFALTAFVTLGLAMSGTFALVFGLIATLNALGSVIVEAGFFWLRRKEPDLRRPFRAIGYPLLPLIALLADVALFFLFSSSDWKGAAVTLGMVLLCIPLAVIARRARLEPSPGKR
jgi:amino acid transporter